MPWIRMDTAMKRDPRIWAMADTLKREPAAIVGYVLNVLAEFPEHAADGDLSAVPDALVEQWAMWPGRRGAFAAQFFAQLCDGRVVRAWEKHNGSAMRALGAARERMRVARTKRERCDVPSGEAFGERSANGSLNSTANVRPLTGTGTETGTSKEQKRGKRAARPEAVVAVPVALPTNLDRPADAPAPEPTPDPVQGEINGHAFDVDPDWHRHAHAEWTKRVGVTDYGRLRRALAPAMEPKGGVQAYPVPLLCRAIAWYAAIRRGTREWEFMSPEKFAGGLSGHIAIALMDADERSKLLPMRGAA